MGSGGKHRFSIRERLRSIESLKEKGLLTSKKHGKAKTYAPAEDAKPKIRSLVDEHTQARKLLNHYLQQETTIKGRQLK